MRVLVGLTASLLFLASRPCRASGFAAARFGGEHGNPTSTNPTALYYNPAGIAFSSGTHVFLDGTLALRHATWEHAAAPSDRPEPPGAEGADVGKAKLFNVFGGPMAGVTTRFGNLALGASFEVPFGGRAHWSTNDKFANSSTFPLAAGGVQRWHGIEGALTFAYFTAGAAYRIGPLSIGISGNLIRSSLVSTQAKNPTGDGSADTSREGRVTLDVNGTHASFGVGAMLEAVEHRLWFGASYQAQPALGAMGLAGTLDTSYRTGNTSFPVVLHQALPDIVRLGARYRPSETLEVRLFGDFTRWSVMKTQCIGIEGHACAVTPTGADATPDTSVNQNLRRKWNDTFGVRVGVSDWVRPNAELFAGAGFETAAVPDTTLDPGLADANNVSAALGARFELVPTLFLAASYTHIQYLNRDNTGKSELAAAEYPTKIPDGGGKYTQWIGLFNLNVEKQF